MSTSVNDAASAPEAVARVAEVMSTYPAPWAICGGWAVDAWLGKLTRDHADVDVAVFQDDNRILFEHLSGWQLVPHDPNVAGDHSGLWDGRRLDLPGHIHGRLDQSEALPERLDGSTDQGFGLDIQVSARSSDEWVFSSEPRITLALERCIRRSPWGLPALAPEGILFYKAHDPRLRDKLDFRALQPLLGGEQRAWLREAISLIDHPWLAHLQG